MGYNKKNIEQKPFNRIHINVQFVVGMKTKEF